MCVNVCFHPLMARIDRWSAADVHLSGKEGSFCTFSGSKQTSWRANFTSQRSLMCCSSATALVECAFSRSQGVELESERTLPTKHTERGGGKERRETGGQRWLSERVLKASWNWLVGLFSFFFLFCFFWSCSWPQSAVSRRALRITDPGKDNNLCIRAQIKVFIRGGLTQMFPFYWPFSHQLFLKRTVFPPPWTRPPRSTGGLRSSSSPCEREGQLLTPPIWSPEICSGGGGRFVVSGLMWKREEGGVGSYSLHITIDFYNTS